MIPESKHAIALALEESSATNIGCILGVLSAIGFNNQTGCLAYKVGYERAYWLLAAELRAIKLGVAKDGPQFPFRIGHFTPQSLCLDEG